jgi:hypothetical protein
LLSRARDKNAFSQLGACSQLSRLAPSTIECRTEHRRENPPLLTGRQGLNSCPGGKTRDRDRMRLRAWNKPRRGGQINELGGGPALGCHRRRRRPVPYRPWSVRRKRRGLEGGRVARSWSCPNVDHCRGKRTASSSARGQRGRGRPGGRSSSSQGRGSGRRRARQSDNLDHPRGGGLCQC